MSRFDFPSFNLTDNASTGERKPISTTTSSLPVPPELVYSSGAELRVAVARDRCRRPTIRRDPPPILRSRRRTAPHRARDVFRWHRARMARARCVEPTSRSPVVTSRSPRATRSRCCRAATACRSRPSWAPTISATGVCISARSSSSRAPRLEDGEPARGCAAAAPPGETYKVQKGDTPHSIADKLGVSEKVAHRAEQASRR